MDTNEDACETTKTNAKLERNSNYDVDCESCKTDGCNSGVIISGRN